MPLPAAINDILNKHDNYIKKSARHAANYFKRNNIKHTILDGIMNLDAKDCEMIYRDMIINLCSGRTQAIYNYGIWAAMMPTKDESIILCLGISFFDN